MNNLAHDHLHLMAFRSPAETVKKQVNNNERLTESVYQVTNVLKRPLNAGGIDGGLTEWKRHAHVPVKLLPLSYGNCTKR